MATVDITAMSVTEPNGDQDLRVATLFLNTSSGGQLAVEISVEVAPTAGTASKIMS